MLARLRGRKRDAAKPGVDGHRVGQRPVGPIAQIRRHDLGCGNGLAGGAHPDLETLAIAVVERHAGGGGLRGLAGLDGFETPAANGRGIGRAGVEAGIVAEHAEQVTVRRFLLEAVRRRLRHGVSLQPPHVDAHLGDVGPAATMFGVDAPHVHRARQFLERSADIFQRVAVAHVDGASAAQVQIVDVLRDAEQAVELHGVRRPAAHSRRPGPRVPTACPCAGGSEWSRRLRFVNC